LLQALVILGHPRPGSLNHAMADAVREELAGLGGSVCYHDLYAERFDPVLPAQEIPKDAKVPADIRTHCEQLADADLIVVVHPNWWGQPPALLKAQTAIVFNTSNTSASRELEAFGERRTGWS
jgi:NAD(P)H dehydrogenase (quinone)